LWFILREQFPIQSGTVQKFFAIIFISDNTSAVVIRKLFPEINDELLAGPIWRGRRADLYLGLVGFHHFFQTA
jgi:hypothetical protein